MLFAGGGLGENPRFIGAFHHSGRFAAFIADAGLEIPDRGVKQRRIHQRTEHLEEDSHFEKVEEKPPMVFSFRERYCIENEDEESEDRSRINNLAEDG